MKGKGGRASKRERRGETFPPNSSKEDAHLTGQVKQNLPDADVFGACATLLQWFGREERDGM